MAQMGVLDCATPAVVTVELCYATFPQICALQMCLTATPSIPSSGPSYLESARLEKAGLHC